MLGLIIIYFIFVSIRRNRVKHQILPSKTIITSTFLNLNNDTDIYNYNHTIKIQKFIDNLKMQTFDTNETETWNNGEVDWEL